MRHTQTSIENMAKRAKLCVQINSPGDGATRYEFFAPSERTHTFGRSLCYCVGAREAWLFLRGWIECKSRPK